MNRDRFDEVERVCQAALDRPRSQRAAFLDEACQGDPNLRAQVDSLLAGASDAASFLEVPAFVNPAPALVPGQRVGPYEVKGKIGTGGMGEVYEARDTRLDRTVALKVLPPLFNSDPDRRARFELEAKAIGGLSHPHICALYDVGEHPSRGAGPPTLYLVMEHVVGQTLAARLRKGSLPLEEALTIAAEIADALATAHKKGIIHRDLKPGNVMLTKSGAKLLDFGLAKLKGHGDQPAAQIASGPTRSVPMTAEGVIVGTLQYMAPEQVEGKPADARTDIWALGAMMYEMVTGKAAFEGTSAANLIGAILEREPTPLSTLRPLVPPAVDRVVRQCLAKSPDERPDTAHDLANELRWVREATGVPTITGVAPASVRRRTFRLAASVVLAALLGAAVTVWLWPRRLADVSPPPVIRSELSVRPAEAVDAGGFSSWTSAAGGSRTAFSWTPDGRSLVFVGRAGGVRQLYVRPLDATEARLLAGTEGATAPAVSPDGQWVAFWAGRALKKVPIAGGPVIQVASSVGLGGPPYGLVWGARDTLFYARSSGIWSIDDAGKEAAVTRLRDDEVFHVLPSVLPNGRVLLYTVRKRRFTIGDEEIVAHVLDTGERRVVLRDAADARYVTTGHLVFVRRGMLLAVPFDAETMQAQGNPVPLFDGVAQALTGGTVADITLAGQFAISPTGTLAWVRGSVGGPPPRALVIVDRAGNVSPINAPVKSYASRLRLSPDGQELIVGVDTGRDIGLWTYHLARHTLTPILQDGEAVCPIWTPDGKHVVFVWLKDGHDSLAWVRADGTAPPEVLVPGYIWPSSWRPGGRELVAVSGNREPVVVTVDGGRATMKPLATTAKGLWESPEFSPDGRWLAYKLNDSGRWEIYIEPYPGPGPRTQVSIDGGHDPTWAPDGRRLFFVRVGAAERRHIMEVDVNLGPSLRVGVPRPLFEFPNSLDMLMFGVANVRAYDLTADGQRFYVVRRSTPPPPPAVTQLNLVQNWFEELKGKVPVK